MHFVKNRIESGGIVILMMWENMTLREQMYTSLFSLLWTIRDSNKSMLSYYYCHRYFVIYLYFFRFFACGSSALSSRAPRMSFDFGFVVSGFGHVTSRASSSQCSQICSYRYHARSFDRPAGVIINLSRSLTDSASGTTWSFENIVMSTIGEVGNSRRDTFPGFVALNAKCLYFEMFGIFRKRFPSFDFQSYTVTFVVLVSGSMINCGTLIPLFVEVATQFATSVATQNVVTLQNVVITTFWLATALTSIGKM